MAKIYLQPGQRIDVAGPAYVGATGTIVDSKLDWGMTALYNTSIDEWSDKNKLVGEYVDLDMKAHHVFMEEQTGRFWFDDEHWF